MKPIILCAQPFLVVHSLPLIVLSFAAWLVLRDSHLLAHYYGDSPRQTIVFFACSAIVWYMFGYVVYLIPSSKLNTRELEELRKNDGIRGVQLPYSLIWFIIRCSILSITEAWAGMAILDSMWRGLIPTSQAAAIHLPVAAGFLALHVIWAFPNLRKAAEC